MVARLYNFTLKLNSHNFIFVKIKTLDPKYNSMHQSDVTKLVFKFDGWMSIFLKW